MRVLLLGSTGVLGRAVLAALAPHHVVLEASRTRASCRADLGDEASLAMLLEACRPLDAIVCTAGEGAFGRFTAMTAATFAAGLRDKLLGQIALARLAATHLRDAGSVTLTAGVLNHRPIAGSACAATINGGLEGFVRAAAREMPRGIRINAVSPTVLQESWDLWGPHFPGFEAVPAHQAALAYLRALEGTLTGQTLLVH